MLTGQVWLKKSNELKPDRKWDLLELNRWVLVENVFLQWWLSEFKINELTYSYKVIPAYLSWYSTVVIFTRTFFFPFPFSFFLFPLLSRFYKLCRSRSCRILIPNNRFIFLCRNVNIVVRLEPLWAVVNLAVQWIIILCAHEMLKPSSKTTRRCTVLNIPSGPKRRLVVFFTPKARIT